MQSSLVLTILLTTAVVEAAEHSASSPAPVLTRAPELVEAGYPPELFAKGVSGEVVLTVDIGADGKVMKAEVVSATHPDFAAAALAAVTRFVFSPAEIDGRPAATRIEYRYVFAPKVVAPPVPDSEAPVLPVNFRGLVRVAGTRKPIAGAGLEVNGQPAGETDAEGRFALRGVAPGAFTIKIHAPFFEPYEGDEEMPAGEALDAKYYLTPVARSPFETVVRTVLDKREVARVQLSHEEVQKVPGSFGDPLRVVESLPGIGRPFGGNGTPLNGTIIIHGAQPEDTAAYFDGVDIPTLFHSYALKSVVNGEFLETVDLYPAGFAARNGRATAGVVDIRSRDLACDMVRGSGQIDVMDAGAFTCTPVGEWRLGVAARRSWVDSVLRIAGPMEGSGDESTPYGGGTIQVLPVYWDYQAKAQRRFGRHSVDVFAFGAHDEFELVQNGGAEDIDSSVKDSSTWHRLLLRHRYRDDRLSLTTAVTPGYYTTGSSEEAAGGRDEDDTWYWSLNLREDAALELNDVFTLQGGVDVNLRDIHYSIGTENNVEIKPFPAPDVSYFSSDQRAEGRAQDYQHAYWLELVTTAGGLTLTTGLRVDRFDFEGVQRIVPQPRLTARYDLFLGTVLKAALGWYQKHSDPAFIVEGLGDPTLDPERARHLVAGFEQRLPELMSVDLSGFYVSKSHLPSPSTRVVRQGGRALPEVWDSTGTGRSYGFDLLLRRLHSPENRFHGWLAYTWARSTITDSSLDPTYQFASVRLNETATLDRRPGERREYLAPNDQTHILTALGQWVLPAGFEFGFRFQMSSGVPLTPLTRGEAFYDADQGKYRLDPKTLETHSSRFPTYHTLDVRLERAFTFDLWKLALYLDVLNVYNHKNVDMYFFDYRYRERQPVTFFPVLPILGAKGEF